MPRSQGRAPYDVRDQVRTSYGGTDMVLWWGDWTNFVQRIAHAGEGYNFLEKNLH